MIYKWTCKFTGAEIEVERKISERDVPPSTEEVSAAGHTSPEDYDWQRSFTVTTNISTFGGKGHW